MSRPPEIKEMEEQIRQLGEEKEAAVAEQDFEKAAAFRDQADKLKKKRDRAIEEWQAKPEASDGVVSADDIAEVVSALTGIPVESVKARDTSQLPAAAKKAAVARGVPEYERSQAASVFQGAEVRIRPGTGFVLLPHTREFDEIYANAIKPALEKNGITALKADDIYETGFILGQVWERLLTSEIVIADMTGINPNVIFELGLCYGLHRSPILLVRSQNELPFNLRNLRNIEYKNTAGGAADLREKLSQTIAVQLSNTRARDE